MIKVKLIQVLESLDDTEWESLGKYLLMHHSKESDNYQLYTYLSRQWKEQKALDYRTVRVDHFTRISPKGFSNLMSKIYLTTLDWLVYYDVHEDPYMRELMIIKALNKRGVYRIVNKRYKKLESDLLDKGSCLDHHRSALLSQLYHSQYYSDNPVKYREGGLLLEKLITSYLQQVSEQLILYEVECHNWGRIQKYDYSDLIMGMNHTMREMPDGQIAQSLQLLVRMVRDLCPEALVKLSDDVLVGKFRERSELHTLVALYCLTYALRFYRESIQVDTDLISSLYDHCLRTDVLLHRGKIPELRFLNIVGTLSFFRSHDEIEVFIYQWIGSVDSQYPDELLAVSMALNCLHHDRYAEIIGHLRTVKYHHPDFHLRAACMECVALYESEERDEIILTYVISNAKRYLKRYKNKMSVSSYMSFMNFFSVVFLLQKAKYKSIPLSLTHYKNLIFRAWITKHVNEKRR